MARKILCNNISQARIKSHPRSVDIPAGSFILFYAEIMIFKFILSLILYISKMSSILKYRDEILQILMV